jgi:hypothetical protein
MAGSHLRARRRSLIPVVTLLALVASPIITLGGGSQPAGADDVTNLQVEATTVSQQLVREQLQVEAYQQQVSVASARVGADGRAEAQLGVQIAQDQHSIGTKTDQVRSLAVRSYTDYGTGVASEDATLFSGSQENAQVASEYSTIAVGRITTALAELRTAQRTFQSSQATLQRQQAQDRTDQAHQSSYLTQADGTQRQLEALQSRVTGQLAAAVDQQAALQSAAAEAAVATAQRSATKAPSGSGGTRPIHNPPTTTTAPPAPAGTSPGPGPAPTTTPSPTTTDPALNPFLQCVVQAESGGNYAAVSPDGQYMGAFQFSQSTWNTAALAAGRPELVGVPPNRASKADQDTVAVALYALDGQQPWLGDRCTQ